MIMAVAFFSPANRRGELWVPKYLVVIEKRDTLNFGYPGVICALPPMSIAAFNVTAVFQVYKQDCSIMGIHFESNFPVYAFALLWFCSAHGTI